MSAPHTTLLPRYRQWNAPRPHSHRTLPNPLVEYYASSSTSEKWTTRELGDKGVEWVPVCPAGGRFKWLGEANVPFVRGWGLADLETEYTGRRGFLAPLTCRLDSGINLLGGCVLASARESHKLQRSRLHIYLIIYDHLSQYQISNELGASVWNERWIFWSHRHSKDLYQWRESINSCVQNPYKIRILEKANAPM